MSTLKHLDAVQNFKTALDTMVAEGEIRAEYGNQILRLMRSGLTGYAHACGFAGGFDYVQRMGKRPSLTRREVEAQLAANPTPTVQKKSVEHVGADSPVVDVPYSRDLYNLKGHEVMQEIAENAGFGKVAEQLAEMPTYTLESIAEQCGVIDWDNLTADQADAVRTLAKNLGVSFGPASKPATIAAKIVEAYA
jgi:hypothetical protein